MRVEIKGALDAAKSMEQGCMDAAGSIRALEGKLKLAGAETANIIEKAGLDDSDFSIGAVDSGMITSTLRFLDVVGIRAVGVVFEYKGKRLSAHAYVPSKDPKFFVHADGGLDYSEVGIRNSLLRLKQEVSLALQIAQERGVGMIALDGSLVPLVSDRPSKDSRLAKDYGELVETYKKLFGKCDEAGILLVGFSKDSRGRRFAEGIKGAGVSLEILNRIGDVQLFSHMLGQDERSTALPYATDPKEHAILSDFEDFGARINVFYQRIWKGAPVYRIEFLGKISDAGKIAGKIAFMCKAGKKYPYPPVLIEADMAAAASKNAAEILDMEMSRQGAVRQVRAERPFR